MRETISAILERHIRAGYAAGGVALVAREDATEVVTAGFSSVETATPMRRDSIFRITSMTKPLTAAVALMLIEEGRLELGEDIDRLLPELANRRVLRRADAQLSDTVGARQAITVADLLTYRLGWGITLTRIPTPLQRRIAELRLPGFGPPDPANELDFDAFLQRLGSLPLMAQPGEQWLYNTGSYVLGALLARAGGVPLPQLMQERLFEPLGMKDTAFWVPEAKRSRLVSAYRHAGPHLELFDAPDRSPWAAPPAFADGAAGLTSTIDDYLAFSRFLLNGGRSARRQLLAEASVAAMTRDCLSEAQRRSGSDILGSGRGWGLGLAVTVDSAAARLPDGSYGWNGGYGSTWVAAPHSGTTAILLTQTLFNSPAPPPIHREFWDTVF